MNDHTRIFALLTKDGGACVETGLCEEHDSSVNRDAARSAVDSDPTVIPGSWTDCGRNPEISCRICGSKSQIKAPNPRWVVAVNGHVETGIRHDTPLDAEGEADEVRLQVADPSTVTILKEED